jgi:hypothetical protein
MEKIMADGSGGSKPAQTGSDGDDFRTDVQFSQHKSSAKQWMCCIVPRAARLTCTRAEFADLWREDTGEDWNESSGATDPAERQRLRDEIDAIVAHLYGLSRADFDHILGTFPLVFPDDDAGRRKRAALLDVYEEQSDIQPG